ncbi:GNAT family N-acetyltransferase [Nocardia callitridis]|uniref:Enhanced intracellular survival protein Eis n=1 Tax=Nocardia callitridis TaxID=648753 RepID=A0ABP9KY06_9NOCA
MPLTNDIAVRSATAEDEAAIQLLLETSFAGQWGADKQAETRALFRIEDALVAVDGDQVVGTTEDRQMTVTVPGAATLTAAGVAAVAVASTHRRRGILRALFTEQHRRIEEAGLPIAILTASEGSIYGRFGYAPTTRENSVTIDRRFAEFLPCAPNVGGVRMSDPTAALDHLRAVYDRWRAVVPAAQVRPEASWRLRLLDIERARGGGSDLFAFVHPDGYALYRYHKREHGIDAQVIELRAVTTDAHAALWRALCGLDITKHLEAVVSDNDPLPYLLTNPRLVRTVQRADALWLRLMDVPTALAARTYGADLDVVLAVHDPFREAGGTFALTIRDGKAACSPTTGAADVDLGIDVLAGLYFGTHPARAFAAANRLRLNDSDLLPTLETAFGSPVDAHLGWHF